MSEILAPLRNAMQHFSFCQKECTLSRENLEKFKGPRLPVGYPDSFASPPKKGIGMLRIVLIPLLFYFGGNLNGGKCAIYTLFVEHVLLIY